MFKKLYKKIRRFNKVILLLTFSDVFVWGSYTIISVLAGIYLSGKLGVDTIKFVGIGTAIYLFTRSVFQIPIGLVNDKYENDKDEIVLLTIGIFLMGLPFLFYPYISEPSHYYVLQFVFGLGVSLNVTNWRKLFALNLDKGKEGIQYGVYDTIMSSSAAGLSIIGGIIANMGDIYFDIVMSTAGIIIMLGGIWILLIHKDEERNSKNN